MQITIENLRFQLITKQPPHSPPSILFTRVGVICKKGGLYAANNPQTARKQPTPLVYQ